MIIFECEQKHIWLFERFSLSRFATYKFTKINYTKAILFILICMYNCTCSFSFQRFFVNFLSHSGARFVTNVSISVASALTWNKTLQGHFIVDIWAWLWARNLICVIIMICVTTIFTACAAACKKLWVWTLWRQCPKCTPTFSCLCTQLHTDAHTTRTSGPEQLSNRVKDDWEAFTDVIVKGMAWFLLASPCSAFQFYSVQALCVSPTGIDG